LRIARKSTGPFGAEKRRSGSFGKKLVAVGREAGAQSGIDAMSTPIRFFADEDVPVFGGFSQ
jgi:hypothetical protein